jgi:hypothetical protein
MGKKIGDKSRFFHRGIRSVIEKGDAFEAHAYLPGADSKDIHVTVQGVLSLVIPKTQEISVGGAQPGEPPSMESFSASGSPFWTPERS